MFSIMQYKLGTNQQNKKPMKALWLQNVLEALGWDRKKKKMKWKFWPSKGPKIANDMSLCLGQSWSGVLETAQPNFRKLVADKRRAVCAAEIYFFNKNQRCMGAQLSVKKKKKHSTIEYYCSTSTLEKVVLQNNLKHKAHLLSWT